MDDHVYRRVLETHSLKVQLRYRRSHAFSVRSPMSCSKKVQLRMFLSEPGSMAISRPSSLRCTSLHFEETPRSQGSRSRKEVSTFRSRRSCSPKVDIRPARYGPQRASICAAWPAAGLLMPFLKTLVMEVHSRSELCSVPRHTPDKLCRREKRDTTADQRSKFGMYICRIT